MGYNGDIPRIDRGLAIYESDYYAVLGVPLSANVKQVSDAYKQVAKCLRVGFVAETLEAQRASRLFAKWVNPAKEILTKETPKLEYDTILKLRIRRLKDQDPNTLWPKSPGASALRRSNTWESDYQAAVKRLASQLYLSLDELPELTTQLSELNLAYLLCKEGIGVGSGIPSVKPTTKPSSTAPVTARIPVSPISAVNASAVNTTAKPTDPKPTDPKPAPPPPPPKPGENRFQQAMQMMERGQTKEAINFFGIAISMDASQPNYFVQRGIAYQKQGYKSMARADFQKALQLDPANEMAQQGMRETVPTQETPIRQTMQPQPIPQDPKRPKPTNPPNNAGKKPNDQDSDGGLLGRFFGRKKS